MKRFYYIVMIGTIVTNLCSQDTTIELTNKIHVENKESIEKEVVRNKLKDSFDNIGKINPIIPNSFYIQELGDIQSLDINRNELLGSVDEFLKDIKRNSTSKLLSEEFSFVFETIYTKQFSDDNNKLIKWLMGYPIIDNRFAELKIELYFKNDIYIGYIYLEKNEKWLVTDFQIDFQERQTFDPSSPKMILY